MNELIYNNISETIPDLNKYSLEIETTELFFKRKGIKESKLDEVFWNHLITLFGRIDTDSQNDIEMDEFEEISDKAKLLLDEYINEISNIRNFNINNFEKKLLTIYTQRMVQED